MNRRQRRAEAKRYGLKFEPQYVAGREPQTHLQMKGVGYERFDGKYVTVSTKTNSPEVE
jgi:hypothetical protein